MRIRPVYHVHRFDAAWGFATETRIVRSEPPATGEPKDNFDYSRICGGRLTNRREGIPSIGRVNYPIDRTTEISF